MLFTQFVIVGKFVSFGLALSGVKELKKNKRNSITGFVHVHGISNMPCYLDIL